MSYLVLDISKYNPIEDYNAAATSVVGVIMRTGYRGRSEGTLTTDPLFETHYNGFVNTGIKIGYYWFTQAITEAEAIEEADYVYSLIKDKKCDFPVYIDTEYSGTDHTGRADALTSEERTPCVLAFCERIKELGYRAGIYASDSWYKSNLILSDITSHEDYSLWVARYSENPPVNVSSYDGWQYTSDGSVQGYSNRVDLSNFYTDVAGWEKEDITSKSITLSVTEYEYSGKEHTPEVSVEECIKDIDYIVEYKNNIKQLTNEDTYNYLLRTEGLERAEQFKKYNEENANKINALNTIAKDETILQNDTLAFNTSFSLKGNDFIFKKAMPSLDIFVEQNVLVKTLKIRIINKANANSILKPTVL